MPYIKPINRVLFEADAAKLGGLASTPGDLNYIITVMVHEYIKKRGLSYTNVNEVVGALECCKLELYRRVATPYEEKKIIENGDVGNLNGL